MDPITLLVVLLIALMIVGLPVFPHSRGWGYYPSGTLAVIVVLIVLVFVL